MRVRLVAWGLGACRSRPRSEGALHHDLECELRMHGARLAVDAAAGELQQPALHPKARSGRSPTGARPAGRSPTGGSPAGGTPRGGALRGGAPPGGAAERRATGEALRLVAATSPHEPRAVIALADAVCILLEYFVSPPPDEGRLVDDCVEAEVRTIGQTLSAELRALLGHPGELNKGGRQAGFLRHRCGSGGRL